MATVLRIKLAIILALLVGSLSAKTWVDSLDVYARTVYMPPNKYVWTWQRAALLHPMVYQHQVLPQPENQVYLDFVQKAMDKRYKNARGKSPNGVASGLGMAYLARVSDDPKYRKAADKVFKDYLNVQRTDNGGISHKAKFKELWDDTIYMIGIFLQQMYLSTGDEKYMDEFVLQFNAHREKLLDPATGLWYHGWDGDEKNRCNWCGQTGWSNNPEKRSNEFWGRGNGWVIVTLGQALEVLPKDHPHRKTMEAYLVEMIENLPNWQDQATGHWFQLPVRTEQEGNYIESSCTAMFAYGILTAIEQGLVSKEEYLPAVHKAYDGLRAHSMKDVGKGHLTVKNVCKGTCIGDMQYYLNRKAESEKPSGIGMFLLFGRAYENFLRSE